MTKITQRPFREVVVSASLDEDWAVAELFDLVIPSLTRFVRNRGVDDAEDLANWVFYEAIRNLDPSKAEAPGQFHAYVHLIARRRIADYYRRRSVRPSRFRSTPQSAPSISATVLPTRSKSQSMTGRSSMV